MLALTQVQYLAPGFAEVHEVHTGSPLNLVQVPALQHLSHTTQLGVIHRLAEGALSATVHVIKIDVKQHWSKYSTRTLSH